MQLAAKPLRARHRRFTRTEILAFIAIMLTLFALFRVFKLLGNENLPAENNTLLTKPAIAVLPFANATTDTSGSLS